MDNRHNGGKPEDWRIVRQDSCFDLSILSWEGLRMSWDCSENTGSHAASRAEKELYRKIQNIKKDRASFSDGDDTNTSAKERFRKTMTMNDLWP